MAAIRFELLNTGSSMFIDSNTIQNNRMNGISFQDCFDGAGDVSITNNYLFQNGCRRVGKKASNNCQPTSTPEGDSRNRHFTIDNLSALQFRDIDGLGMLYIADNTIDSNFCDGVKFERNDYSNVTLVNNTITSNVAYFWGSSPVTDSGTLQATNTTFTTGNITTVTTLQYDIVNSSGKNYVDTVTLSNNPNLGADEEYLGIRLLFAAPADPTDVEIYSYDSSNNIAWVSYVIADEGFNTFVNKPADNAAFTMDDYNYAYLDSGTLTLANGASAVDSYYSGLMITIDNFTSGVTVAASQPGPDNTVTLENASGTDDYYAGYHMIDIGADTVTGLEYNLINSYEGSSGIAFMRVDYETKPSGTIDIGYPIKYINEYDGTTKVIEVGGSYTNVPSGVGYTIAGGVSANSGYVDGSGMQSRDIIDGTLLIKDSTIRNNWRGMWFRDIPNTNNNFSNPNVVIQGTVVEYNMGIGIRGDEVAWIMIGDPDYVPNVYWSGGCGKSAGYYSKANGMTHGAAGVQPGLFYRPDGGNSACRVPKRDAWVADAMANGGTSVFKNGSWGVQMRGDNLAYQGNVWFNGGQMRGNSSNGIGVQGGDVHVTVSNVFFGGNADAVATRGGGEVILANVIVMGSDAVESMGGGTFYLRNYSYVHTLARSYSQGYLQSHSYVACMQICRIYVHGQGGGNFDVSDYGYLETGRFIGGGPAFHDHGGFGMMSGEHSKGINLYDGGFGGCYGGRRNGHRFWGYEDLWSSANPHPNNVNSLGGCMPVAEASVIRGNNVYGGITVARHGHKIYENWIAGGIGLAAGDSSYSAWDNVFGGDPATNAIPCNHDNYCPQSARCTLTAPTLDSISIADNDSNDPAAAEAGFTNSQSVTVTSDDIDGDSRPQIAGYDMGADECTSCTPPPPTLTSITLTDRDGLNSPDAEFTNEDKVDVTISASANPTDMMLCEDSGFSGCSWNGSYATPTTFTFANQTNELKTVYATLKNAYGGSSGSQFDTITLDTSAPTIGASTLTAPNGTESWTIGNAEDITWSSFSDTNLKTNPVYLFYDINSGGDSYPNTIANGISATGPYSWTVVNDESTSARVKITAYDKAGNAASDTSNADFAIIASGGGGGGCSTPDVCASGCDYTTITAALAVLDTVCVGDGTYTENIVIGDSRTRLNMDSRVLL